MTLTEILEQQKEKQSICYLKLVSGGQGEVKEYDVSWDKKKRGWIAIDTFTGHALLTVYNGMPVEIKEKFNKAWLANLINFAWKNVR